MSERPVSTIEKLHKTEMKSCLVKLHALVLKVSCSRHRLARSACNHAEGEPIFAFAGSKFVVGFVTEENKPVVNEISTGASAVFPVGALLPHSACSVNYTCSIM